MRTLAIIIAGLLLSSCAPGTKLGSIAGGQCQLPGVHTPQYQILGKTRYDQNWADDVTEGLVGGCGQPRPLSRPPGLDHKMPVKAPVKAPVKPKKKWLPDLSRKPAPPPPPVVNAPPEPADLPPMRKADPWTPVPVMPVPVKPEPPKPLDPPAQPKPTPPTQSDWWYYLRR
jgi:hypothetical protein